MPQRFKLEHIVNNFYTQGELSFFPTGSRIYSPIGNNLLKVDFEKNQSLLVNCDVQASIEKIQFCRQGQLMLLADQADRVYLLNAASEKTLGSKKFKDKVSHMGFSNNNAFFYVVSGRYVFIYERPESLTNILLEPFLQVKKYNSKASRQISAMKLTADDACMIYAADDNIVRVQPVFNSEGFNEKFELVGHKGQVTDFCDALASFGTLATLDVNGLLMVWKLVDKTDEDLGKQKGSNRPGHKITETSNTETQEPVNRTDPNLSSLEKKLLASKFILGKKQLIYQENTVMNTYKFENDMLLVSFRNKTFCLYSLNFESEEFVKTIMSFKLSEGLTSSLTFHPTKTLLSCAVAEKGQLIVWDWKSKHYLLQQSSFNIQISTYAFSPNADILVVADFKGDIRLFDTKTFFNTITFSDCNAKITGLKFINQKTLVCTSLDGVARVYDLVKYKLFRELRPESPNQLLCCDTEKNGEIVFAGGFDPYCVYMWSYKTGLLLDVIAGHTGPVDIVKYSNATQTMVSASWDKTVRVMKPFSRMLNSEELRINDKIMALSLSKNELSFCLATYKNEIQIYGVESAQLTALIDCSQQFSNTAITSIELSFDGTKCYAVGNKNRLFTYDVRHRSVQDQFPITQNRDYKNTVERMNNANIRDGYDLDALDRAKDRQIGETTLPGSQLESYAKNKGARLNEFGGLGLSDDGKYLALVSSDGLCLFSTSGSRTGLVIDEHIDKKYLLELLKDKKYVEYTCACLKIENRELFRPVMDKLDRRSIYSIVTLLNERETSLLLKWLIELWKTVADVEIMLVWFESVFMLGSTKNLNAERVPQLKTVINELRYRVEEFMELSSSSRAMLSYLIDQANN